MDILISNVPAIGCACVGAALGYLGCVLLLDRGFYALILSGGLLGLAAGIVRNRSALVAVDCGVLAVVAGLLAERQAPSETRSFDGSGREAAEWANQLIYHMTESALQNVVWTFRSAPTGRPKTLHDI